MALKIIILGILCIALCAHADPGKLLDLGPYSIDTKLDSSDKYVPLDKYDLLATDKASQYLQMSVKNDSYNPYVMSKLPDFDIGLLIGTVELRNLKVVGIKSVKLDGVEMRMNYGLKPKKSPFRVDLKLTSPLVQVDVDFSSVFLSGHLKVKLNNVKAQIATKARVAAKNRISDDSVFKLHYVGVKGDVNNLQVQFDVDNPDIVDNVDLIKDTISFAKDEIVLYAIKTAEKKFNGELRKVAAVDLQNYLVPDRPK